MPKKLKLVSKRVARLKETFLEKEKKQPFNPAYVIGFSYALAVFVCKENCFDTFLAEQDREIFKIPRSFKKKTVVLKVKNGKVTYAKTN